METWLHNLFHNKVDRSKQRPDKQRRLRKNLIQMAGSLLFGRAAKVGGEGAVKTKRELFQDHFPCLVSLCRSLRLAVDKTFTSRTWRGHLQADWFGYGSGIYCILLNRPSVV